MQEETSTKDLTARLALIESMLAEGRRQSESWGWTFLLWGVALYVAIVWGTWGQKLSVWGRSDLAWPVTMLAASLLTIAIGLKKGRRQPGTTVGRALVSLWICGGISMFLLFPALSISGRLDQHSFVAMIAGVLGIANGVSGMILRWKMQFACAVVWWVTSIAACFGSDAQLTAIFLAAIFICQIVFGVYTMILESRRRPAGVVHA